jgi:DNA-binding transcriptional MocR family regulator
MENDSSIERTVRALREQAAGRELGELMPSSRTVGAELGVGPVTVRRAVSQLVAEGVLSTRPGVGTFVARPTRRPVADTAWQQVALGASPVDAGGLDAQRRLRERPDVLQLAAGYPTAGLRPDGRLGAALARAGRRPQAWSAAPPEGIAELRTWFASQVGVEVEEIVVSSGSQGAISAAMRALLPSGSPVLFSVPTYPGALAAARSAGLVPVPVPCDEEGAIPELLERAFATSEARLAYLQPTFANPGGQSLAAGRRDQVLAIAADAGAFLIEDDWARWLDHHSPPPPPLIRDDQHGHVINLVSLTKVVAPSLRVGAIAARGPVLRRIASMRLLDEFFGPRPLQEAAIDFVTSAGWRSHLRTVSATLRRRVEALTASLLRHLPDCSFEIPHGGISIWLRLPDGVDDEAVVVAALARGVAVSAGSAFTLGEQEHRHLRLSFLAIEEGAIEEAVTRLAEAIAEQR